MRASRINQLSIVTRFNLSYKDFLKKNVDNVKFINYVSMNSLIMCDFRTKNQTGGIYEDKGRFSKHDSKGSRGILQ